MRATLAMVALVATSMVAGAFLVPLALLLRTQVQTQATVVAEQWAAAVVPALALSARPADLERVVARLDTRCDLRTARAATASSGVGSPARTMPDTVAPTR